MKIEYLDGTLLKKVLIGAANFLDENKEKVNDLNVFPVPDGDTGTNMCLTMQSAIKHILSVDSNDIEDIATALSNGSLMGARGNSGVILSQLFRGFARGLKGKQKLNTKDLANAFKLGSDTAYKAVMKPTEGTVLTVAKECAQKSLKLCKQEKNIVEFLRDVINYGNVVLDKTPDMLPVLKEAGVVDAGGKGLIIILTGAFQTLTTDEKIELKDISVSSKKNVVNKKVDTSDIKFGYCTEFIVNNTNYNAEKFREELSRYGDSLLAVGGDNFIKVHIHTNNPGIVLEKGLSIGEINDIKIDNMRYQHRSLVVNEEKIKQVDLKKDENNKKIKKYSFITVAMGEGIKNVFKDLNVDYVISGGQTMNPSTQDILDAIDKVSGENIIILPNNKNIVLASKQAQKLSKRNVHVFPTKTIPEGIASLLAFNIELSVEKNLENMKSAVKNVKSGEVTFAVRDTEIDKMKIKKDDVIGIYSGKIKSKGKDISKVSLNLLKKLVDKNSELVTIFYGNNIDKKEAEKLANAAEGMFENCDVEFIYGGQPLYYYIFSVE